MRKVLFLLLTLGLAALSVPGCERAIQHPMPLTEMPTVEDPEVLTVALVQAAIDFHKIDGTEATVAHYNDPARIDGQWYVFITDRDDIFIAHPAAPHVIGKDSKTILGLDGKPTGAEKATTTGLWTEYLWLNPKTNKIELKRTWSIRHEGYLFGSGYYEPWAPDPDTLTLSSKDDPVAFTHDFVLQAIARYEFAGVEATAAHYNDPASMDGEWYVFIADANDISIASVPNPDFIGTPLKESIGPDGFKVGAELIKATGTGRWSAYLWLNPMTGENQYKRSWVIRHDGYLFGSGYYINEPTEDTSQ